MNKAKICEYCGGKEDVTKWTVQRVDWILCNNCAENVSMYDIKKKARAVHKSLSKKSTDAKI